MTHSRRQLVLAGKPVSNAWTSVRRYCGLEWAGHPAETWAFRYFDDVDTDPDHLTPVDVACAGALHPGLSRGDLAFFWDHRQRLEQWISELPPGQNGPLNLADAGTEVISILEELPALAEGTSLSLASKVLHRKRPWLIPMIDREVIDRYRPLTGKRRAGEAWAPLLHHLSADLQRNSELLTEFGFVLTVERGTPIRGVSHLRIIDIAIWMDAHHGLPS